MFEATDLSIIRVSSYRVKLAGRLFSFSFFLSEKRARCLLISQGGEMPGKAFTKE